MTNHEQAIHNAVRDAIRSHTVSSTEAVAIAKFAARETVDRMTQEAAAKAYGGARGN